MAEAFALASPPPRGSILDAAMRALVERGVLAVAVARAGVLVWTSPSFDALFRGRVRTISSLVRATDEARVLAAIDAGAREVAFEGKRADGTIFDAELTVVSGALPEDAAVLLATDVSEWRRTERQLAAMAFRDPLTGLPNRALFLDRLQQLVHSARRDARVFGVLMCDLDGFKNVNDTLGHDAGDELLRQVAQRLEGAVRESDTVARLGGDEFVVLLSRLASGADAANVGDRLLRAIAEPFIVAGEHCTIGMSVGVATAPANGTEIDALVAGSDAAMYESKRAGTNRLTFASSTGAPYLPFLQWRDAYLVGVETVDAQHRHLVALVNRYGDALKAGREQGVLSLAAGDLVRATRAHFTTEEQLMARRPGWSREPEHREEHARLLEEVQHLTRDADARSMTMTMHVLQEWLVRHIVEHDKPMGEWLRARS